MFFFILCKLCWFLTNNQTISNNFDAIGKSYYWSKSVNLILKKYMKSYWNGIKNKDKELRNNANKWKLGDRFHQTQITQ